MPRWSEQSKVKAEATRSANRARRGAIPARRKEDVALPSSVLDDYATPLFGGRRAPRLSDEWVSE